MMLVCGVYLLLSNCEKNNDPSPITDKLTNHSDCKNAKSLMVIQDTPDTLSCVSFLYGPSAKKLQLIHINAGFNCCPGKLSCNFSLQNDTIVIAEHDKDQSCDCDCLFDLEIELNGIEPQKYQVRFIEPYAGDQELLIFELDLASDTEGNYCVTRKHYPWGMN